MEKKNVLGNSLQVAALTRLRVILGMANVIIVQTDRDNILYALRSMNDFYIFQKNKVMIYPPQDRNLIFQG